MRFLLVMLLIACGNRVAITPKTPAVPVESPARDLAAAKTATPTGDHHAPAKDPRVVDLDIIRITANGTDMTSVATADEFKKANEAAKAGRTDEALGIYRGIVQQFPESRFAPVSLFNIAAIFDGRGDPGQTIATLRQLVTSYPDARESIDGHLYIAAIQADHQQWADALATLEAVLPRANLTFADRLEALARKGYVLLELKRYDDADAALTAAIAEWRKAPHIDDPYYIAMAHYYRGEVAHRRFADAPIRLPDDQLIADLEQKRVYAVAAYDQWKEALRFHHAYWATASGYQMSQIFVELWQATVTAPYPEKVDAPSRARYITEVHERVREHLAKALEGHRMNVEMAKAFGVDTDWSKGSEQQAAKIMEMIAKDSSGDYLTPPNR
jgi:tetratricopeptide (TPR) repeat protein